MPGAGHDPQELSEQALRDLRWLLLSPPPLASGRFSAEVQAFDPAQRELIEDWLESLQAAPDPLRQAMERHRAAPLRLGRYAERLLEFFLRSGPTHRLVAANLPLRKASGSKGQQATTLGEIDFLLEDASGRPWHWELAVKFFLCVAPGQQAQPEDFIGPDPTDTLAGKLRTLFERQLRRTPPSPWDERAWRPAAFTRGWMFYRFEQAPAHCDALSPDHLSGHWLRWSELARLPEARFLVPPRARWMSPVRAGAEDSFLSRDELAGRNPPALASSRSASAHATTGRAHGAWRRHCLARNATLLRRARQLALTR